MSARWWAAILAVLWMIPTVGCSGGASSEPSGSKVPQVDLEGLRSRLGAIAREELGAAAGDEYTSLALLAVRLVKASTGRTTLSHFGDRPLLDSKETWPLCLLVIDLAELRSLETGPDLPGADSEFMMFDSRIGGWPVLLQGPVQATSQEMSQRAGPNNDEASWRLFAQIDTNEDTGWMWGDVGLIYFTMHDEDIRTRAYDQAWLVLQSG